MAPENSANEKEKYDPNIVHYDEKDQKEFELPIGNESAMDEISDHIEKHIGEIDSVFHEIISDQVHIDVHWVKPNEKFPFHTLVTSGMSDRKMTVPEGLESEQYAELCILLPNDWNYTEGKFQMMDKVFEGEEHYWPIGWLKYLARFPHLYQTWLGYGHTLPNGEEAAPFAPNTELGCMWLLPSISLPEEFETLEISASKTIKFYCLYPIFKEEMDFKLKKGSDALIDKFEKNQILDVIDIRRKNTCKKKGFLGLFS